MWFPVCLFPLIDLCIPDIIPAAPGCPVGRVYCASWCNFFLCIPVVRLFSSWCLCLAVQKAIDDRDSTVNIAETRCTEWVVYMPQIINKTETSRKTNHRQCVNVYALFVNVRLCGTFVLLLFLTFWSVSLLIQRKIHQVDARWDEPKQM